ncbi:mechanosensitive ion channel domain-containing protein [Chelatococcus reniformis]|uniref:Cyclic nucleotide-binding domain-containing protein n=1 Tax=Chelatococcus reniformis TaxID=1494448 RepID=A0A916UPZ9_9HYPH|nr:mechanosensitive ion channel family protein [Chelatococcus reniformis]GGC82188.1 hypothetical protein GCM10010994_45140 [Chelatococcus reniformis]
MTTEAFGTLLAHPLAQLNLVGIAGIVVWHLIPSTRATTRLVVQILFFAVMTAILVAHGVAPHHFEGFGAGDGTELALISAKLLWWLHLAWAIIGFVRLYLVIEGHPREARLLQDLVVAVIYLGVALSALAFVFGVPVATLVATSGVVAVILGLALQSTLSDVFSGIALTLGRPYRLGDWIRLNDGTEGRVVESTWRSTQIQTSSHNIVVLPNSLLAKVGLSNYSRPDGTHAQRVTVRIAPTRMPAVVAEVMRTALASCSSILREPPPGVSLKGVDALAIELELEYRVESLAQRTAARNELLDLVYRHCKASGLLLALPREATVMVSELPGEGTARPPRVTPLELIQAIPVFAALTGEEKAALAEETSTRAVRPDEVIAEPGDVLPALMMVRHGIIVVRDGEREVGRLAPGDFFGETGLLAGLGEPHTLQALTRVTLYEIDQAALAPLLETRPALAEDLATALAARARAGLLAEDRHPHHPRSVAAFLRAVHGVFGARSVAR